MKNHDAFLEERIMERKAMMLSWKERIVDRKT
jgi:hypothetical protein